MLAGDATFNRHRTVVPLRLPATAVLPGVSERGVQVAFRLDPWELSSGLLTIGDVAATHQCVAPRNGAEQHGDDAEDRGRVSVRLDDRGDHEGERERERKEGPDDRYPLRPLEALARRRFTVHPASQRCAPESSLKNCGRPPLTKGVHESGEWLSEGELAPQMCRCAFGCERPSDTPVRTPVREP